MLATSVCWGINIHQKISTCNHRTASFLCPRAEHLKCQPTHTEEAAISIAHLHCTTTTSSVSAVHWNFFGMKTFLLLWPVSNLWHEMVTAEPCWCYQMLGLIVAEESSLTWRNRHTRSWCISLIGRIVECKEASSTGTHFWVLEKTLKTVQNQGRIEHLLSCADHCAQQVQDHCKPQIAGCYSSVAWSWSSTTSAGNSPSSATLDSKQIPLMVI